MPKKPISMCLHCQKLAPSRMIRFPVISPNHKQHLAENHGGVDFTCCGGSPITSKWSRPE